LERVKGIEPSSSAWKAAGKLNDFNDHCVKSRPKTVPNSPIFATGIYRQKITPSSSIAASQKQSAEKRINRPPPQPSMPVVHHAIVKLIG